MFYGNNEGLYDMLAVAFGAIALLFAYVNTRKDGDTFVAVGAVIVAGVVWGWAYLN